MKNKRENLEKIVLSILIFILIMYISFSLVFFSIFNVSKKFLNKKNVSEFISDINIIDIIKGELGNDIGEFNLIENELQSIGITTEGINSFMESEGVKEFSGNIIIDIFDKISNNNFVKYEMSSDEVIGLIEDNIDVLKTNSLLSEEQLIDKLNSKVPSLVSKINGLIDKLCEKLETSEIFKEYQNYIVMSMGILDVIFSDAVYCIILLTLLSFVTLLFFIRKDIYKSLKWLGISFIIPGIILFILCYIIINNISIDNFLINSVINITCNSLNKDSLIYTIIGIIIIAVNIIIYFIKKRKKNV